MEDREVLARGGDGLNGSYHHESLLDHGRVCCMQSVNSSSKLIEHVGVLVDLLYDDVTLERLLLLQQVLCCSSIVWRLGEETSKE